MISSASTQNLLAVPSIPWAVEKIQPDGSVIEVYLRGDEKVHWMESLDGYSLMYNEDKFIVYAQLDEKGDMVPSSYIYRMDDNESSEMKRALSSVPKKLRYSQEQVNVLLQVWNIEEGMATRNSGQRSTVKGDKKALCILVGFSDKTFTKTQEQFENLINQVDYNEGSAVGSVKDFYRENSYGQMDLTVSVVGPVTLSRNVSYYTASDPRYKIFAQEAMELADDLVDFSEFANENGEVETVHIIFAGYGDEAINNGQQIWSHKWQLNSPITIDGVRCSVYSCSPELRNSYGNEITSIGVICHELCHVFGSDDYYDTDYGYYNYDTTGEWDLMASGSWNRDGDVPAHINMFQKILYGWVEPVELDVNPKSIRNMPNSVENPVAYIIKPYTNNEQYILENRQKVGFDAEVPGSGLLIYHIHNSASTGSINNMNHPQQAYVVCASSSTAIPTSSVSSYGNINSTGAPFASTAARNEFSTTSKPAMFRWSGSSGTINGVLDKPLTNITQKDGLVSFDFKGGVVFEGECLPVQDLIINLEHDLVSISWDAPVNSDEAEYTYDIYLNEELLEANIDTVNHSFSVEEEGDYKVCIIAKVNDVCESEEVCETFEFIIPIECLPVENLAVVEKNNILNVSWDAPANSDEAEYTYEIYLNEELLEDNVVVTNYSFTPEEDGTYDFCVIAKVTDECEAEQVCESIEYKGTGILDIEKESAVKLYPTVVTSSITIEVSSQATITLKDSSGRILAKTISQDKTFLMNMDAYSSGIYLITVECADTVTTHKVIKK